MKPKLLSLLCLGYVLFVFYGSLVPFDLRADWAQVPEAARQAWSAWPFGSSHRTSIPDLVSNVALYVPLGVLVGARRTLRRRDSRLLALGTAASLALAVSLAVEAMQMFSPSRYVSAQDVLMSVCGGLVGGLVGVVAGRAGWVRLRRLLRRWWACQRIHFLTVFLVVLFLAEALFPYRPTLDVGEVWQGVKGSQLGWNEGLGMYPWAYWVFWRLCSFAALGAAILLSLAREAHLRWSRALTTAIGFTVAAELAKLFIVSRHFNVANVIVSAGGICAGVAIAAVLTRRAAFTSRAKQGDPH